MKCLEQRFDYVTWSFHLHSTFTSPPLHDIFFLNDLKFTSDIKNLKLEKFIWGIQNLKKLVFQIHFFQNLILKVFFIF